jgi:hypothetical protein
MSHLDQEGRLILAAEDCEPAMFRELHYFSSFEDKIIRHLLIHGPVLLRGSRGSGKSALMIEAEYRCNHHADYKHSAIGVYLSLRYLPLIRSTGKDYEGIFLSLLISRLRENLAEMKIFHAFNCSPDLGSVRAALSELSVKLGKRIILLFDDAAHIGREAPLEEFFDIFRTLSGNKVSCKAAIYPGVTHTGRRFDIYQDATVIDLARNEEAAGYSEFFYSVVERRYKHARKDWRFSRDLSFGEVIDLLARAVLGNVRGFVRFCSELDEQFREERGRIIGLPETNDMLLRMARDHYWPLLEELRPKLGIFEPFIEPAKTLAEELYVAVAQKVPASRSALIHKDHLDRLTKLFEILEYTGFIAKREASRAMKSGGRGARFAMNLCNLLEHRPKARLTHELLKKWCERDEEAVEFGRGAKLSEVELPERRQDADLSILDAPVSVLLRSATYPYGLTQRKIDELTKASINTIRQIMESPDARLDAVETIGPSWVRRIRNVVAQAVWM